MGYFDGILVSEMEPFLWYFGDRVRWDILMDFGIRNEAFLMVFWCQSQVGYHDGILVSEMEPFLWYFV